MSESQIIHLAADLSFLHTDYLWRMPGSWVGYDYYSTSEFYEDIARIAQRGVMDMLFFGDTGGTPEDYGGSHEAPRSLRRQMAAARHGADDSADGEGRARCRASPSPCRRPITIRSMSRASSMRSIM